MSNPFSTFDELKDWPGRKQPVNRPTSTPAASEPDPLAWDKKPVVYVHNGITREFFTIGHLADAFGRSPVTIRSWESKGVMPNTPYRSPRPRGEALPGKKSKGRRLWTRSQIEGMLRIAREEGVILNGKPPSKQFSQRVAALFRELLEQETES